MPNADTPKFEDLSLDVLARIDDLCWEFECAWNTGQRPRPEDMLARVDHAERGVLLDALLRLDAAYRRQHGEPSLVQDYLARFPEHATIVRAVFAEEPPIIGTVPHAPPPVPTEEVLDRTPPPLLRYSDPGPPNLGGMGVVWRCRDVRLRQWVAIKVLQRRWCARPEVVRRFQAEAQLTSQLQHPNIPPVHDVGDLPDGRPYYCMRWVEGQTLSAMLRQTPVSERVARLLPVFEQVCGAMAYAHSVDVIHRDLKPGNVMVGMFGEVQVMDWGLAKVLGEVESVAVETVWAEEMAKTQAGAVLGTFAYMPPEQARAQSATADKRSDVFGLGAMLCEILTGSPPYSGDGAVERARAGDVSQAQERLAACGADGELVRLAQVCLQADPAARPADAGVVAQAVRTHRAGVEERLRLAEVDAARRQVQAEEGRKRQRVQRIGVAAVIGVLLLGMVGTTVGLVLANQSASTAENAKLAAQGEQTKAETAAAREERERKYAQDYARFLQDDFLALTSEEEQNCFGESGLCGLSRHTTLKQMLDRAAAKLDERMDLEPRIEAELRWIIGVNSRGMGEYARAVVFLERCVNLRQTFLDESHHDVLTAKTSLAVAYLAVGKQREAIQLHEQVRDARVETLGLHHPDTLLTLSNLAWAYQDARRFSEALQLNKQIYDAQQKRHGKRHPTTLRAMNQLAMAYWTAGDLPTAIRLHKEALDAQLAVLGPDHLDTLTSFHNLACGYRLTGRFGESIPLLQNVWAARLRILGQDHPNTLLAQNSLAWAYQDAGELRKAIRLYEQVREARLTILGPNHCDTLLTLNNLAWAYQQVGDFSKALPLYQQVRKAQLQILKPNHPDLLRTLNEVAHVSWMCGKRPEAIRGHEVVLAARRKVLEPDHPDTLLSLNNLGWGYKHTNKLPLATQLYREAATGIEKHQFAHPHALLIIPNTIAIYEQVRQWDKAEVWRRKWISFVKSEAPRHRWLAFVRDKSGSDAVWYSGELAGLGLNLLHQEKWQQAETTLADCLAIREKNAPEAWTTFNTRSLLGGALLGQKKHAEAEPHLLAGWQGLRKREKDIPPQWKNHLVEAVDRLIELNRATEKPDQVKAWQAERASLLKRLNPPEKK